MSVFLPESTPSGYVTPHRQPCTRRDKQSHLQTGYESARMGGDGLTEKSCPSRSQTLGFLLKEAGHQTPYLEVSFKVQSALENAQIWIHTKVKITFSHTSVSSMGFLNSGEDRALKKLNTYNRKAGSPQIRLQLLCSFLSDNHWTEIFFLPKREKKKYFC